MAVTKKNAAKKQQVDENQIITLYMNDILRNEEPKNIYMFCLNHQIEESDFYTFYGSFEALRKQIWSKFLQNAIATINKDKAYGSYADKDKLLALYFTIFEVFTLNRSYILYALKENKEGLKNLLEISLFRKEFKEFVADIIKTDTPTSEKIARLTKPVFSEGAWIQFLFILKFWLEDQSKGFEKTDILIEKSVNTVVGLLSTKQLEDLFDLGKFIWKERHQ